MKRRTVFLSVCHALVDFSCALILFSRFRWESGWEVSLLFYNFCAFALQLPMGILADYWRKPERFSALGCLLVAVGFLLPGVMLTAIVIGIGNGLYHVGGGVEVMDGDFKAGTLGVFVAPGAIGLYLGTLLGKRTAMFSVPVAILLLVSAAVCLLFAKEKEQTQRENAPWSVMILVAMFLVVVLRSLGGMLQSFSWKTGVLAFLAVVCTAGGKAAGGYLEEYIGFKKAATLSLVLCAGLFLIGQYAAAGLAAIFLFNMTMPMTLYSLCKRYTASCGAMFGLLTLALFIGFLPQYFGVSMPGDGKFWLSGIAILSLVLLLPAAERGRGNG